MAGRKDRDHRLKLNRETVQDLAEAETRRAAGGFQVPTIDPSGQTNCNAATITRDRTTCHVYCTYAFP